MRMMISLAAVAACAAEAAAMPPAEADSLRMAELSEVVVSGVRARSDAPFAVANIKKDKLQAFSRTGQELPMLFARTPGVLAWSENGLGTGTSYLRIRGAGDSRINVTLDGVPLNSPEDQCVFWANMNSYSALLSSVQIQRGVGTSTNGDGAFGGTVALATATPSELPSAELSASYGSYNTWNAGGQFSSGLIGRHFILDGAYHETQTDGFLHGTAGRSGSYTGGLTYAADRYIIRYRNIGNFESMGQAWNGVTAGNDDLSLMDGTYGAATGIRTYKDLWERGLGKFNSLYEGLDTDADGGFVLSPDGKYSASRYKMADGSYWGKTTDRFNQNHNILSAAVEFSQRWRANVSLHYTYGHGYYDEFRPNNKLAKFGLPLFVREDGSKVKRTDFVRVKGLTQHTYGVVANASYTDDLWNIVGGVALQQFSGSHFGYLTYMADPQVRAKYMGAGDYKYYDSDAKKGDHSGFVKATAKLTGALSAFADVQYRHVKYETSGLNDKFVAQADGTYANQRLDIDRDYNFFNPKAGLNFAAGGHRAYASIALSHREPERNNFTDNGSYPAPSAEQLLDIELGYQYDTDGLHLGVNGYWMKYHNQFVQTGEVSDIGEALTTNIDSSYRLGLELTASWSPCRLLTLEGNAALSQNRIKDFDEVVEDWDNEETGTARFHYEDSHLAFSPDAILNGFIDFHYRGLQAVWHTAFVSRMYLDNTESAARSLPCYSASDASVQYTLKGRQRVCGVREAVVGMTFGNIFNRRYANNGWVYSAVSASSGHPADNRYCQIGFIPAAGFTLMGNLTLRF